MANQRNKFLFHPSLRSGSQRDKSLLHPSLRSGSQRDKSLLHPSLRSGKQCEICGKGSIMVRKLRKLRGKYNPTVKTRKYPNLQWVKLPNGKRVKACAKCIKALSKRK